MYKTSLNNLKIKVATDYIENKYNNNKTKPTYNMLLKDQEFIDYYNAYKDGLFKKASIKVKKGYI